MFHFRSIVCHLFCKLYQQNIAVLHFDRGTELPLDMFHNTEVPNGCHCHSDWMSERYIFRHAAANSNPCCVDIFLLNNFSFSANAHASSTSRYYMLHAATYCNANVQITKFDIPYNLSATTLTDM